MTKPGRDLSKALGKAASWPDDRPIVEANDLHLRFSGLTAIGGVSFTVMPNEMLAIIGPNGAGKTSVFNCLSGVYRPQEGTLTFLGESVLDKAPDEIAALGMARTFQNVELFRNLTLLDNMMLGRHQHLRYGPFAAMLYVGKARKQESYHRAVVEEIIEFLELEPYRRFPVGLLPYGIQKRIELGRALAMQPRLLLLDEPAAGMNLEETEDMARFLLDIREELQVAMILVEHHMGLVMDIADRVLVLDFGRPVAFDVPRVVQNNPDVIKAYLGEQHKAAKDANEEAI